MKYKVGDKVLVRSDLAKYKAYTMENGKQIEAVPPMLPYAGDVVTIKTAREDFYSVEGCHYKFVDEMFEGKVFTEVPALETGMFGTTTLGKRFVVAGGMLVYQCEGFDDAEKMARKDRIDKLFANCYSYYQLECELNRYADGIQSRKLVYDKSRRIKEMTLKEIEEALGYKVCLKGRG